jgi:hypothetical protein
VGWKRASKEVTALTGKVAICSGEKPRGMGAEAEGERRAYCWRPERSGVGWKGLPRPKMGVPIVYSVGGGESRSGVGEEEGRAVITPAMLVPRIKGSFSPMKSPASRPKVSWGRTVAASEEAFGKWRGEEEMEGEGRRVGTDVA